MVPAELIESLIEREVGDRVICTYDYSTKNTLSDEVMGYVHAHPIKTVVGTTLGLTLATLAAPYYTNPIGSLCSAMENLSWDLVEKASVALGLMRLTTTLLSVNPLRNAKREFKRMQRNLQRYQNSSIPIKSQTDLFEALNLIRYLPRTSLETDHDHYLLANLASRITEQLYDQQFVSQPNILKLDLHKKQAALDGDEQPYLPTVRRNPQYKDLFGKIVEEDYQPEEIVRWMRRYTKTGNADKKCKLNFNELELLEELCRNTVLQYRTQGGFWDGRGLQYGLLSPTNPGKGVATRMGTGGESKPLLVYPIYTEGRPNGNFAAEKIESGIFIGALGKGAGKEATGGIIITEHVPSEAILKDASDNSFMSRKPLIIIGPQGIESMISPDFKGLVISCGEEITQVIVNSTNINYKNELVHTGFPDRHALTSIIRNYEEYWQMRKDGHVAFDDSITNVFDGWIQRSQKFIDL